MSTTLPTPTDIVYPDSDGAPIADNTLQFRWVTTIEGNLEILFAARNDVFVAGDLLWYPVEGNNKLSTAPDALVVFGRTKGYRGSYMQWREDGIAPQVVWEVLSPNNRPGELLEKFEFYQRYGVEEYIQYDPDRVRLRVWVRVGEQLVEVEEPWGWRSPRTGVLLRRGEEEMEVLSPDGQRFLTFVELEQRRAEAEQRAEAADERAQAADKRAEAAQERAQAADQRAEAAEQRAKDARQQADEDRRRAADEKRRADEAQEQTRRLLEQMRQLGIDANLPGAKPPDQP